MVFVDLANDLLLEPGVENSDDVFTFGRVGQLLFGASRLDLQFL